jgi:hypothetical protein
VRPLKPLKEGPRHATVSPLQGVLHRWPSWAKRDEYAHFNLTKLVSPLLPSLGFPALFKLIVGTVHIPIVRNAEPIPKKKWPVIVFSHGLGCARFTYSQVCYDLASHGFIVAAPEHRDGSGCLSFFNESGTKQWIPHRRVEHSENEYDVRHEQVSAEGKPRDRGQPNSTFFLPRFSSIKDAPRSGGLWTCWPRSTRVRSSASLF